MTSSLVGSEMCIRDRSKTLCDCTRNYGRIRDVSGRLLPELCCTDRSPTCLLYTSDAADDM
eukprot:4028040-Prorocentrum_lima.AAC.1